MVICIVFSPLHWITFRLATGRCRYDSFIFSGQDFLNYATGVLVTAFIISCLIGKFDQLASVLMALYVLLMIFFIHIPRASENTNDMLNIFRNIMVVGALLMYAKAFAKERFLQ